MANGESAFDILIRELDPETTSFCLDTYWITEELMAERVKLKLPADERYQQRFFRQILLNSQRIDNLPEQNKRDVFLLTCDLYNRFFQTQRFVYDIGSFKKQYALETLDCLDFAFGIVLFFSINKAKENGISELLSIKSTPGGIRSHRGACILFS